MSYELLDKINSPEDVKALDRKEIPTLCGEIREFLIDEVGKSGGHLASNLGVTELTVAIHRIFDSPRDHVIFDVGHQSYVHKIITGRKDGFDSMRKPGGMSGFTLMRESEHDAFGAGHSSTSISAALGYAEADRLRGSEAYSIAVIGDGAYTGGMVHEAINNCDPELRLVIILNENGMSISLNKGRFASYLSRVRVSKKYQSWKKGTKSFLSRLHFIGRAITAVLAFFKNKFKNLLFSSNYFEDLGLYYIGPVDGNDYNKVERALKKAKELKKCVVVHVKTTKGMGYAPAEESPDTFHSIHKSAAAPDSYHSVFADKLISLAKTDENIVAVTAAMGMGTGLSGFGEVYPKRYFDVGIAEGHALTFSAGLAAAGYKPFVSVYSTFLQRGYDSIVHDICLQNLPVKLIIDRASLAKSDGATHHGIFDVAFLSHIPNIKILAPVTYGSLSCALDEALASDTPIAIRYPNSAESERVNAVFYKDGNYADFGVRTGFDADSTPDYLFITYGALVTRVLEAADVLAVRGESVGVILIERLKPYGDIAARIAKYVTGAKSVLFAEEGMKNGGAGMLLFDELLAIDKDVAAKYKISAIDDNFASPTEPCDLYAFVGLDAEHLANKIMEK